MTFWGHSANGRGDGLFERLADHVQAVTGTAATFAAAFGCEEQARVAGLLHDLGKYADQFQDRIRGKGAGRDHASAGAFVASVLYRRLGLLPAMAIAAHHSGLETLEFDYEKYAKVLRRRLDQTDRCTSSDVRSLQQRSMADRITLPPRPVTGLVPSGTFAASDMFDVRMLFSSLVDADFLETEAHFDGDASTPRRPRAAGPALRADAAIDALDRHVKEFKPPTNALQRTRGELFDACLRAADQPAGLFSLTAPTGSGKTLAMLAFALHHARRHNLRRIVLVMPFLNIIDQTAALYRNVFAERIDAEPHALLEHHSLIRDGDEKKKNDEEPADTEGVAAAAPGGRRKPALNRLLAENWDAPIVLTTSVQCLESMMSHKPSACRKLHRLAGSVILFDEVQTLPPKFAKATLATLSRLADPAGPYGSTVLFATATQPAFGVLHEQVGKIVRQRLAAARDQRRRPAHVRDRRQAHRNALATPRADRRHRARRGIGRPRSGARHRQPQASRDRVAERAARSRGRQVDSASPVDEHVPRPPACDAKDDSRATRSRRADARRVDAVRRGGRRSRLRTRLPRARAARRDLSGGWPVQSAGARATPGRVTVFRFEADGKAEYPPGYREGLDATQNWLDAIAKDHNLDALDLLNDPQRIAAYFKLLYGASGRDRGEHNDERALMSALGAGDFADVAREYRLIDQNSISILVPYDRKAFERLRDEAKAGFANGDARRRWRQAATHHAVSIIRPKIDSPLSGHIEPVDFFAGRETETSEADWFIALDGIEYDDLTGLVLPDASAGWMP